MIKIPFSFISMRLRVVGILYRKEMKRGTPSPVLDEIKKIGTVLSISVGMISSFLVTKTNDKGPISKKILLN